MKAITYSLFGLGKQTPANSFEFSSYLRGTFINVRMNRILYPGWKNVIMVDEQSYNSKYRPIFEWLQDKGLADVQIVPEAPLCAAMLYRLKPIFEQEGGVWKYDHVLCRDTDSIATYREAQMVEQWIREDKTICCITDSISHNIPMMGGMIGIRPRHIMDRIGTRNFDKLIQQGQGIDFSRKGSDQDFLNRIIYPKCADSSSEFFIKGMPYNLAEGNGRHYSVPDIDVPGVGREYECTNEFAGHVGAAGYYETVTMKFIMTQDPFRDEYKEIEEQFIPIMYWRG